MRIENYLLSHVRENVLAAIEDAGGNEVFFVGTLNNEGLVSSVLVGARGNEVSVPALTPYLETSDVVLHNHPSGNLTPSGADLGIASFLETGVSAST